MHSNEPTSNPATSNNVYFAPVREFGEDVAFVHRLYPALGFTLDARQALTFATVADGAMFIARYPEIAKMGLKLKAYERD